VDRAVASIRACTWTSSNHTDENISIRLQFTLTEAVNIIIIIINFVIGNCQDAISHDIYAITTIFETQIKQTKWAPKTTTTNK